MCVPDAFYDEGITAIIEERDTLKAELERLKARELSLHDALNMQMGDLTKIEEVELERDGARAERDYFEAELKSTKRALVMAMLAKEAADGQYKR